MKKRGGGWGGGKSLGNRGGDLNLNPITDVCNVQFVHGQRFANKRECLDALQNYSIVISINSIMFNSIAIRHGNYINIFLII